MKSYRAFAITLSTMALMSGLMTWPAGCPCNQSVATNLVTGDTNSASDISVRGPAIGPG